MLTSLRRVYPASVVIAICVVFRCPQHVAAPYSTTTGKIKNICFCILSYDNCSTKNTAAVFCSDSNKPIAEQPCSRSRPAGCKIQPVQL